MTWEGAKAFYDEQLVAAIELPASFEDRTTTDEKRIYSNDYIALMTNRFEGFKVAEPNSIDYLAQMSLEAYFDERTDAVNAEYQLIYMPNYNQVMRYTYYTPYVPDIRGGTDYLPAVEYFFVKNSCLYQVIFLGRSSIEDYSATGDRSQDFQYLIDFSNEFFKRVWFPIDEFG